MLFAKNNPTKVMESFFLFLEPQPWIRPNMEKHMNFIFITILKYHYEKKGCFAISLAIHFLSYKGHLQLAIFICREC
jgi:hypothetical protein